MNDVTMFLPESCCHLLDDAQTAARTGPCTSALFCLLCKEASQTSSPFACVTISGVTVIAWKKKQVNSALHVIC